MNPETSQVIAAPLLKALCDRQYEKRKNAAAEIETQFKNMLKQDNAVEKIRKLLKDFDRELISSSTSTMKKAGLIALASAAIGLEGHAEKFIDLIAPPIINCFQDPEGRVRYYACESMYNVAKVTRRHCLQHFNKIFDGLCKLFADMDMEVKNGAQYLDRLLKDVVAEGRQFDIASFLPLLKERVGNLNPFIRQLVISWIVLLDSIPDVGLLGHLPAFLDGLFQMLRDSNRDIRHAADSCLAEFLTQIREERGGDAGPVIKAVTPILVSLVANCGAEDTFLKLTSLVWLNSFVERAHTMASAAVPEGGEPAGSDEEDLYPLFLDGILQCVDDGEEEIDRIALVTHHRLMERVAADDGDSPQKQANFTGLVRILQRRLMQPGTSRKVACLAWLTLLIQKQPGLMGQMSGDLLGPVFSTLKQSDQEVVVAALQVIAQLAAVGDIFEAAASRLIRLFAEDRRMLESRGRLIFRQLCVHVDVKRLFLTTGKEIEQETDLEFAHQLVQTLNWILLTAKETRGFREELAQNKDPALIRALLVPWFNNPVASLALALWVGEFELSFEIVKRFALFEPSVELLVQIDQLIHLIESPIFSRLRLQLMDVEGRPFLLKTLLGIAMVLPQASAFQVLSRRLELVKTSHALWHQGGPRDLERQEREGSFPLERDESGQPQSRAGPSRTGGGSATPGNRKGQSDRTGVDEGGKLPGSLGVSFPNTSPDMPIPFSPVRHGSSLGAELSSLLALFDSIVDAHKNFSN
uniref:Vacuolar protein 14 C-terminal Fig4-binding domain-containing protein n=1 Tax=Chromera velia CCMP2878 TaxID=1169474 RepID=A0A0G4G9J8_9ALVE|mmetsp:Transcript_44373/g.87672  ORF Transcript_44373/g.87672 Transcript_44373/m.87672 type:complete len:752 (+) Transcript_44373:147-2402(+)|eukprot:Cvel_20812.t1-p1 / transcript=Cvel_20812.t1 / gene=Cvel_20812 / organism=Chromera_velia_CCMP2878 / gene_product=Protein VAC14 homolog, putative / transcript_product=Protein VAC14 homolog, putative / location=Cvel_scaffold1902:8966-17152(-) / protein_length=751 / sequence_SO=supercontig / SO=protein_coding / is_pseudo=false